MSALLAIILLALGSWSILSLPRKLRRQRASVALWFAFILLALCGLALGVWCAFYCEYHVGQNYRFGSFPLPVVIFHLEDGSWVDFPVPLFQAWLTAMANIISITAVLTAPVWLASWCSSKR